MYQGWAELGFEVTEGIPRKEKKKSDGSRGSRGMTEFRQNPFRGNCPRHNSAETFLGIVPWKLSVAQFRGNFPRNKFRGNFPRHNSAETFRGIIPRKLSAAQFRGIFPRNFAAEP